MGSVSCIGSGQWNWKLLLFQSTLLASGIALTILGGLKLSSVINLKGVNSLAFIGMGAGLVVALSIYQAVRCVKQRFGKLPSTTTEEVSTPEADQAEKELIGDKKDKKEDIAPEDGEWCIGLSGSSQEEGDSVGGKNRKDEFEELAFCIGFSALLPDS